MHQEIDSDSSAAIAEDITGDPIGNGRSNFNYVPEQFKSKFTNLAGTAEYDFGFASLSSTTTYSDVNRLEVIDASRIFGVFFPLLSARPVLASHLSRTASRWRKSRKN